MRDFLTTTMPVPVWAVVLMLALLCGCLWAIRGATSALSELLATYRDLRCPAAARSTPEGA